MSVRNDITFGAWLLTASLLVATPLAAGNDLDVTMRMVEDSEDLTNSVTREIRLPELPARRDRAIDRGQARPEAPGREVSKEARERGREFGQSASEQAREARGKKPEPGIDRLPQRARDARERKPDMPPQSSRP